MPDANKFLAKAYRALKPGGVIATMDDMERGWAEPWLEYFFEFILPVHTLTYKQKLIKLFKPNNDFKVVGFDFFETKKDKLKFKYKSDKKIQAWHNEGTISQKELLAKCKEWSFSNLKLYAGDVKKTTKKYVKDNFGSRIALLYLDVDNYDGTLAILKNLYSKMSKGGIIVLDEYGLKGHGESEAVDKFFKDKKIKLQSFSWANSPTAYIVIN